MFLGMSLGFFWPFQAGTGGSHVSGTRPQNASGSILYTECSVGFHNAMGSSCRHISMSTWELGSFLDQFPTKANQGKSALMSVRLIRIRSFQYVCSNSQLEKALAQNLKTKPVKRACVCVCVCSLCQCLSVSVSQCLSVSVSQCPSSMIATGALPHLVNEVSWTPRMARSQKRFDVSTFHNIFPHCKGQGYKMLQSWDGMDGSQGPSSVII